MSLSALCLVSVQDSMASKTDMPVFRKGQKTMKMLVLSIYLASESSYLASFSRCPDNSQVYQINSH